MDGSSGENEDKLAPRKIVKIVKKMVKKKWSKKCQKVVKKLQTVAITL
jgi:hypothetical protein